MRDIQIRGGERGSLADAMTRDYGHVTNNVLVEEMPAIILNDDGVITDCNSACCNLLCCARAEIVWQHISKFLPQMHDAMLFNDCHLNPHLRYLSRIGHHFQAVRNDGTVFSSKVFFVELGNASERFIRAIIRPILQETSNA